MIIMIMILIMIIIMMIIQINDNYLLRDLAPALASRPPLCPGSLFVWGFDYKFTN